jgi:hypothetical protein
MACSIRAPFSDLSGAQSENERILYGQNEVQEERCSVFSIYRRLPKRQRRAESPVHRVGKDRDWVHLRR